MDMRKAVKTDHPPLGRMHRRSSIHLALAGFLASIVRIAQAVAEQSMRQSTDIDGVTIEIMRCRRKAGVLTIVLGFKNEGTGRAKFYPIGLMDKISEYYFIANMRKYYILRDADNHPIAKDVNELELNPGEIWNFWAKFPAPPPDVKAVEFYTPWTLPFEDVAIVD